MWTTCAEGSGYVRLKESGHTLVVALALSVVSVGFSTSAARAQNAPPAEQANAPAEVEEEPQPLRAFRKPNRVPEGDAVFSIKLLIIGPLLLAFIGLIISLLMKPKDNTSVFKDPTPVPRKQKGKSGSRSSSRERDDWDSDSYNF